MQSLKAQLNAALPLGFVYLADIDPSIIQSIRYAGDENFVGRTIDGYQSDCVVLTTQAAQALAQVQRQLEPLGYGLVVYDAYRPQRASEDFWNWTHDLEDQGMKDKYYPTLDKKDFFAGYVSRKSGHSRGSTVDLSIIKLDKQLHPVIVSTVTLSNGEEVPFLDDGTVNMGTSFDLLHPASSHHSTLVNDEAQVNRELLLTIMHQNRFVEYSKEWWHYTLHPEPYPDTLFDFCIVSAKSID